MLFNIFSFFSFFFALLVRADLFQSFFSFQKHDINSQEAENRMHAQCAVLLHCLDKA